MNDKAPGIIFVWLLAAVLAAIASALVLSQVSGVRCDVSGQTPPASLTPETSHPAPIFIAPAERVTNYGRGGSCMFAAAEDVLRWQGRTAEADYWRRHFYGGTSHPMETIADVAARRGLQVAYTTGGDENLPGSLRGEPLGRRDPLDG